MYKEGGGQTKFGSCEEEWPNTTRLRLDKYERPNTNIWALWIEGINIKFRLCGGSRAKHGGLGLKARDIGPNAT